MRLVQEHAVYAGMVEAMDLAVGRVLAKLDELGLRDNTLVIFTSDNGPHNESKHDLTRFNPSGPLTGIKRSLTDGGIRVPFIAWWPGKVAPGAESGHVGYFGDWMATAADLAGAPMPAERDSLSLVPTLVGQTGAQKRHEFLYWEFHEGGFKQAALYQGRWKGIRSGSPDAPVVLYDLQNDIAETANVAATPRDYRKDRRLSAEHARTELPEWEPRWQPQRNHPKPGNGDHAHAFPAERHHCCLLIGTGRLMSATPLSLQPPRWAAWSGQLLGRRNVKCGVRGCRDETYRFFSVILTPPPSV